MRCPTCGFENRDGARFCGECGRPSAPEVLCPGCRRSNPTGRKFCDGCGRRLPPAAGPAGPLAARSPRDDTPPRRGSVPKVPLVKV